MPPLDTDSTFPDDVDTFPVIDASAGDTLHTVGKEHDHLHNLIANAIIATQQSVLTLTPGGAAVSEVNGQVGVVVLDAPDVGADPAGSATTAQAAAIAASQPVDADLTAIAALSTTSFGRALLELADAAAMRTAAGLGTAATQATGAFDAAGAAAAAQAASQPVDSDLTAIAALSTSSFGRSFLALVDAAGARTLLGLGTAATQASTAFDAAGTATAAVAAEATARDAAITTAINALVAGAPGALDTLLEISNQFTTDEGIVAALTTTVGGKLAKASNLSDVTSASTARTNLGVAIGTDVEAHDADLTAIAALDSSTSGAIASDGSGWIKKTYAQLKTALGLVKADVGLGNVDNTADAAKTFTESQITGLVSDLAAKQPLDSDLTTIAGLTATTDSILQSKSSAWTVRTPAQFKTDLVLVKGDVGLGNVDNTADTAKPISTLTQAALDLKAGLSAPTFTGLPNAPGFTLTGTGGIFGVFTMGDFAATPVATLRRANGSSGSESQLLNTQALGTISFAGWNNTNGAYLSAAAIAAFAEQDFTTTGFRGTRLAFSTAPSSVNGGALTRLIIGNDGKVYFGSSTSATTSIDQSGNALIGGTLGVTGTLSAAAITATTVAATSSVLSSSPSTGIGYATGAGGTITQGSGSGKATAVTLSKITGEITTDAAALGAAANVTFVLTNTAIGANDLVAVEHLSGGTAGSYIVYSSGVAAGSCSITIRNTTGGSLSQAIVLKVVVIKAVTS